MAYKGYQNATLAAYLLAVVLTCLGFQIHCREWCCPAWCTARHCSKKNQRKKKNTQHIQYIIADSSSASGSDGSESEWGGSEEDSSRSSSHGEEHWDGGGSSQGPINPTSGVPILLEIQRYKRRVLRPTKRMEDEAARDEEATLQQLVAER
jgi:hypothetical protein